MFKSGPPNPCDKVDDDEKEACLQYIKKCKQFEGKIQLDNPKRPMCNIFGSNFGPSDLQKLKN